MTLAYFAYPLDHVIDDSVARAYAPVKRAMFDAGWQMFDPGSAFLGTESERPLDPRVQQINDSAIDRADVVVALLPVESHSVGVPLEIGLAADLGKTVYVYRQKRSWAIAREGVYQFDSIETLCDAISTFHVEPAKVQFHGPDIRDSGHPMAGLWDLATEPKTEVRVQGEGRLPTRAYPDDAGFDLYVQGDHTIEPHVRIPTQVPCGVAVELPPGWWGLLVPRSSTFILGLVMNPSIIDPGWRGGLFALVRSIEHTIQLHDGDRIAQLIPIPAFPAGVPIRRVDQLSPHDRGTNGFGSTGR
jgi:dUTP pyrophosphatase